MMRLAEAARAIGARLEGADARFASVSTDTRSLGRGALFVAIRGERFDGHAFLAQAKSAGAAGALVDARHEGSAPLPVLVVADTRDGLAALARHWRGRFAQGRVGRAAPVVIAIAGSNGKTTTKEMLAAILRRHAGEAAVHVTAGNLNTDIGVSLTVLGLKAAHRICVAELGTNHRGEIARVAAIAQPTVAVVTNALRDHLEFLGSVAEMAEENADALRALPADGVAIVNADDAHAERFRRAAGARRVVEFGTGPRAAVGGRSLGAAGGLASEIELRLPDDTVRTTLAIAGAHNLANALAAAACASVAGADARAIAEGLAAFRPYSGRLQARASSAGGTVIDDSYNANPDSVRAAIDVLAGAGGRTVLVLGDMGELGPDGAALHAEVGEYARARGVGALHCLGAASRAAAEAFGAGARHHASLEALLAALEPPGAGTTLLVKGSRFMQMERVVAALTGARMEAH